MVDWKPCTFCGGKVTDSFKRVFHCTKCFAEASEGGAGATAEEIRALVRAVRHFMLSSEERRSIDEMKVAVDKFRDIT